MFLAGPHTPPTFEKALGSPVSSRSSVTSLSFESTIFYAKSTFEKALGSPAPTRRSNW